MPSRLQVPEYLSPRRGVVISGPMGGNKNSTCQAFLAWAEPIDRAQYGIARQQPVSLTTRAPRPTDAPGQYRHVTMDDFDAAIREGRLSEWATHSGNMYGKEVTDTAKPFFVECEVTGAQQFARQMASADALGSLSLIYIRQAGGAEQLVRQIMARPGSETEAERMQRAARYPGELAFILKHEQEMPYLFISNVPGDVTSTHEPVCWAAAGIQSRDITRTVIEDDVASAIAFFERELGPDLPQVVSQVAA